MEKIFFFILAIVMLPLGIVTLLRPEKVKWMPVYKFYNWMLGEKAALMITRLSAGLGAIALAVVLFLYVFGVI